ncbi:hypothetical protein IGI37_000187 [Enterococcus sp. AZ194]|uniref:hypothetical protein n=1 Tax=Enterococcus sp. AZ194 TaxID=2774629 RepID=UPI003F24E0FB
MNTQMISGLSPELQMIGTVLSLIFSVLLIVAGLYFKKKNKNWWSASVLLGVVSIIVNAFQLMS